MGEQIGASVVGFGQFLFAEHGMDMAVAGTTDRQDSAQAVIAVEAFADALQAMGPPGDEVMPGGAHLGPATDLALRDRLHARVYAGGRASVAGAPRSVRASSR